MCEALELLPDHRMSLETATLPTEPVSVSARCQAFQHRVKVMVRRTNVQLIDTGRCNFRSAVTLAFGE